MSESRFLEENAGRFRRKHPDEDGWTVYRIDPQGALSAEHLLPLFLMGCNCGAIVRQDIRIDTSWSHGKDRPRDSWTDRPHARRGEGMTDENWLGEIDILWQDVPIHFARTIQAGRYEDRITTYVATKDRTALEDIFRRLGAYRRKHDRVDRTIMVLGEGTIDRPKAGWEDLILPDRTRDDIRESVQSFQNSRQLYKELDLPYRRGLLFTGPPGCGKTTAIRTVAANFKGSVFIQSLKSTTNDFELARAFRLATQDSPAMLILEDLDRLANHEKVSMSYLLNLLDGIKPLDGLLVIATTNHPEKLDQALLQRPSRFDRVFHFRLPGYAERLAFIEFRARGRFPRPACEEAARRTEGFTMAYVQEAVTGALLRCMCKKREFTAKELIDSIGKLKEQKQSGDRPDAMIPQHGSVGFVTVNGNGN